MYHYAGNNPVKYTDPDGNAVHVVIGAGIGAVVGLGNQVIKDVLAGSVSSISDYVSSIACGTATGAVGGLAQNVANTGTELITKSFNGEKLI